MALTDEQYQQIFRYADNEMNAAELKTFEAALVANKELQEEVELYKQIRSLSESVEEKTSKTNPWLSEEKKSDKETWSMLAEARKKWENQYEDELKLKYGISDSITIAKSQKSKIRRINFSGWLIAASLIGLISLGTVWWYYKDKKEDSKVSINNKKADSGVVTDRTRDSVENIIQIQPTPPPESASSKNIDERKEENKRNVLFADNFKPDSVPPDKEGPLETAFAYYENKQFEKASREFENADIGPVTRGDAEEYTKLLTFYIHYYQALSYLAASIKTSQAISELRKAITTSPDAAWTTKAQWYLALAYIKSDEVNQAKALLKEVAGNNIVPGLKQKAIALSEAFNEGER